MISKISVTNEIILALQQGHITHWFPMKHFTSLFISCLLLGLLIVLTPTPSAAKDDLFPAYSCIQPNVAFWTKIYSKYPSSQGLIHDSNNLAIIYDTINLHDSDSIEGKQANECNITALKEKYSTILSRLGQGNKPSTPEEARVAALFGSHAKQTTFRAAADNVRFQRCMSDRFRAGLVRSGRYISHIKKIFKDYGLPSDLAYLPHVESSFDYQAYSKAGAAGIWQFMPSTGREFMTINDSVDERRDPLLSTHAAAQFLKGNYRKLGSWPLALTGYNHGPNAMLRAKNALGSYEAIFKKYDGDRFGFASKNFYAEFLAAREIARNYQHYFPGLKMDPPASTKVVAVKHASGIQVLAGQFKVSTTALAELNPALTKSVISGKRYVPKGYRLHLPQTAQASGVSTASLAANTSKKARPKNQPAQIHLVKRGETIHKIAERYGVSRRDLIAHNQLNNAEIITVGQPLRIPQDRPSKKTAM